MKCTKEKRLSYTEKAEKIVKAMTLEEKVDLMGANVSVENLKEAMAALMKEHYNFTPYDAGGNETYQVAPMLFCDGPRGVVCGTGRSTCFPVSMLRGATFDTELEEKIGHAIGKEVRAYGGNTFAGVCINLPYNPGWGRSQETYGEESFHLGEMGSALVRGVQDEDVIACIKHYAFNQMEISRFKVSVDCDKRTEREVFLPHFKKCIDQGAASVMSSYNLYKGIKCGHHDYLLNQVLKKEWDFDGFVMSDFIWGVTDTVEAANGGQNIEMCLTNYFGPKLVEAVKEGKVPESKIDDAALRIVRTILAFEDAYRKTYGEEVIGCKEHIQLALQAAREGITLIQNKNKVLPFDRKKCRKIAVIGKLAEKEDIGDYGSSRVFPPYIITPLKGIAEAVPEAEVIYNDGSDLEHAKRIAKEADAVVFVVGYDHDDEGEFISEQKSDNYTGGLGGDRKDSLGLHKDEQELLSAVGPVNTNSAVVLIGGNMILMEKWKDCVSSVLMAFYAGMEGGTAIAEILFGDVNPSGKLPYVVPVSDQDLPQVNWDTTSQWYDYYHGYAKLDKEGKKPYLPYGFGLSYTEYKYEEAEFCANDQEVTASCTVTNTGEREGTEIVQMYIGFAESSVDRPVKLLRGFTRVRLAPSESRRVTISCPVEELCWYNPVTEQMELEHMKYQIYIGANESDEALLMGTVEI